MNEASDDILLHLQDLGRVEDVCIEIGEVVTLPAYSSDYTLGEIQSDFPHLTLDTVSRGRSSRTACQTHLVA